MAKQAEPELIQFRFSHYNEKARWALDYKQVPYRRRSVLPGMHVPYLQKRTGQTETPVLRVGDEYVIGSARILEYAEQHWPQPPLLPDDPALRREALDLQAWLDQEVGGPARCAFFHAVLPGGKQFSDLYSGDHAAWQRAAYRQLFPVLRRVLAKVYRVDEDHAAQGRNRIRSALDLIAERSAGSGFLVGAQFTVADIAAASLLSICVLPEQFPVIMPDQMDPCWQRWLDEWADHPAAQWIRNLYATHRGTAVIA